MASWLLGRLLPTLLVLHIILLRAAGSQSVTFTLTNNCDRTVWPGLLSSAGTSPLSTTGFALQKGESRSVDAPANWSGRMWARTLCSTDPSTGHFSCSTGDCGSGQLDCSGGGAAPPATLAEFTLAGADGKDFYDVSLVDGYNLPMLVQPQGGSGACETTGCLVDLNGMCPNELKVMAASRVGDAEGPNSNPGTAAAAACKSACEAFAKPEYCCSGEYGNPNTCRPTSYSQLFKNACPRAYSYAYDDGTSTFTCTAASAYVITFCPAAGAASENPEAAALPLVNNTMVYLGGKFVSSASRVGIGGSVPLCLLAAMAVSWKLLQQLF